MKKTPPSCLLVLVLICTWLPAQASMVIDSLAGPVTANEISSFKTFMQGQAPPTANTYDNNMADGTAGMNCEALGLIYEVTNDPALLNQMIQYADAFISLRNDYTDQRVMWDGAVDPVWLTKAASASDAGYAGCENNDIVGHIAFCAKLILQSPSLWSATVPDGNPHGYGATYYERATNYIVQMEYSEDNYFNKYFIDFSTYRVTAPTSSAWTSLGESTTAWNRQMMFLSGWQRLSECHQILADNAYKVGVYDSTVQAAMNWFSSQLQPYTTNGQPVYNWVYSPGGSGSEDNTLHSTYDIWGITRAWASGRYSLTNATMIPFANTLQYVMNVSTNHISYYVNGTSSPNSPRSFIYPGWMPIANFGPTTYSIMANMNIAQGSQGSTAIFDAFILWVKNARYLGIYPSNNNSADFSLNTPWVENIDTSGNPVNYPVTVNPLYGFGADGVTLSMSGQPSGVTASFTSGSNATLTISASTSVPTGVYAATISGTGSGITRVAPITLVVTNIGSTPDFSISATPSSQTVTAGNATNYTVNIGSINGFNGTVNLSISGVPTGASANFNPSAVTGSGSSTLTVTTTTNVAAGSYPMTVTGTSGTLTHSTSITLVVNAAGGTWTFINDTDTGITYSSGWSYSANRNYGDYQNDVHYTTGNTNYAQYTFTGTGIEYITETYTDEGNVDVYLDGVLQTTVNCNTATRQAQVAIYSNTGLSSGAHTIKIVKSSGTYMLLDAFAFTSGAPQPPAAPTGLTATPGDTQVTLGWTASSGATSYNVKRGTVSGGPYTTISNITTTGYTDTGLVDGTTYYYVVSALNSAGESSNSTEAGATPCAVPATPTGLTATGGTRQVALGWTASAGAASYNVKRAAGSGGPYSTIASGVTATSYTDTGLSDGTTYFYVVSAVNSCGESSDSAYRGATTIPAAPTGLMATPGNAQVALSWTASTGAASYNVKRSTVTGGPYTAIATGVTAASYTDTTAVNGTTYYYVVSAVNSSGESANSGEVSATPQAPTAPAAPTQLTASGARKKVTLNWTQSTSPNITQNKIYRSTTNGGPYSLVNTITAATSYSDTGLTSGKTYYYVVTAVNSSSLESPFSNQASATAK